MNKEYISQAVTTTLKVENSATVKIKDNYYKFSIAEEVSFEHLSEEALKEVNFEVEREILIERVNSLIDEQIVEIQDTYL